MTNKIQDKIISNQITIAISKLNSLYSELQSAIINGKIDTAIDTSYKIDSIIWSIKPEETSSKKNDLLEAFYEIINPIKF